MCRNILTQVSIDKGQYCIHIKTITYTGPDNFIKSVLCLERGIAGFPLFYRRCLLKMHLVRA